ncbi:Rox3 protein [Saccharomycopsis crataegensis]|uniref:Mediator of RNA polymerase II transcription subunit 19 n=1 Tax=Saccharomycopsis crataegensis TaxID=43959 RepID=A0AAV5QP23_9ASCO|nr:Rox3 protein [Saccharomycopsis crataegensis]
MSPSDFYYIDSNRFYEPSRPSPKQNLIELYGLNSLALSVARTNPDGTKGVKLRKSYKSHISDLPGKHTIIDTEKDISPVVFRPVYENDANDTSKTEIKTLDMNFLLDKLRFDRTPDSGIPNFDVANLAVSDSSTLKNGGISNGDSEGKKRKKKSTGNDEDSKRRRVATTPSTS